MPSPRNNYGFSAGIDGNMAHRENSLDSIMSDGTGEGNTKRTKETGVLIGQDGKKMVPNPKIHKNAAVNNIFN